MISISISGFTALTPATNPASNFWISGNSTPPIKPTLLVFVFKAAAAPTKNEPCSSAKSIPATLPGSTAESIIPKLTSGYAVATSVIESANKNPTPIITSLPSSAQRPSNSALFSPPSFGSRS